MKNVIGIFKRELRGYFDSPIAYIFIVVFLLLSSWLFFRSFFLVGQADLRSFFSLLPWIFLFFVPAVAMRQWAEERKLGTLELLMTLPVRDGEVILGKFLAGLALIAATVFLSFPLVVAAAKLGDLDVGPVVGGYVGAVLLGGAYLAIGLFVSSLTENQIVAFILGVVACFVLFILGEPFVLFNAPSALAPVFSFLGLGAHFQSMARGVIDSRDVIYYASVILFFLMLNRISLEGRRWA